VASGRFPFLPPPERAAETMVAVAYISQQNDSDPIR
jgi:hypothetical protein